MNDRRGHTLLTIHERFGREDGGSREWRNELTAACRRCGLLALERLFEEGHPSSPFQQARGVALMLRLVLAAGVALLVAVSAAAATACRPLHGTFTTGIKNAPAGQLDGAWQIDLLSNGRYTIQRNGAVLIRGRNYGDGDHDQLRSRDRSRGVYRSGGRRHVPVVAPGRVAPPDNSSRRMPRSACRAHNASAEEGRLSKPKVQHLGRRVVGVVVGGSAARARTPPM